MTIASGMRSIHRRKATAISDGGTGATTAPEALAALGAPTLEGDNVFTGDNLFGTLYSDRVGTDGDLTLFTTDIITLEGGGGARSSAFDLTALTGTGQYMTVPDKSGTIALTGDPVYTAYKAQGSVYTASSTDCVINCTGTWTLTLPTAVGVSGKFYFVKNSGVGTVTMAGTGGQTFDGVASPTVAAGASLTVCSDGANWLIL